MNTTTTTQNMKKSFDTTSFPTCSLRTSHLFTQARCHRVSGIWVRMTPSLIKSLNQTASFPAKIKESGWWRFYVGRCSYWLGDDLRYRWKRQELEPAEPNLEGKFHPDDMSWLSLVGLLWLLLFLKLLKLLQMELLNAPAVGSYALRSIIWFGR